MKRIYYLLLFTIIVFPAYSQNNLPEHMEDFFTQKREAYFSIEASTPKEIIPLMNMISVDEIKDGELRAYANKKEFSKFLELGYNYELLPNPGDLLDPEMYDGSKEVYEWDEYPTYEAYVAMMYQFATDHPDICEVFSIGNSTDGREILMAKISDNVSVNEHEPQFLYTGQMHGDEIVTYIMFLRVIDHLLENYGTDPLVTDLVDNLEIWINPLSNPDGTYAGGNSSVNGATRSNANGVDLNRNYADPKGGEHPDGNVYQPETILFMELADQNHFVMSANSHSGTEVVNYPWDTWYELHPDDAWWYFVSREYADHVHDNAPSNYFDGYDDGITNGAAWYSVEGGRQDYMNYFQNCREFTLELSDAKMLPASQLVAHWDYNRDAMMDYIQQMLYGFKGTVTDAATGDAVVAKVETLNHDDRNTFVFSDVTSGKYNRVIKGGTYDIKFSAEGYMPQVFTDVSVEDYNTTILDVQLVAAALIADFSANQTTIALGTTIQFTEETFGNPDTYQWTFEGGTPSTSNEENPSVTYNEIGSFDVTLVVTKGSEEHQITKENYISVNEEYIMGNQEITTCSGLFYDNGGDENYTDNADFTTTIYGDASNSDYSLVVEFLEFSVETNDGCTYDYLEIYNGENTSAPLIGRFCGINPGTVVSDNDAHALTFVFRSDGSVNQAGWKATISCDIMDVVDQENTLNFKLFPNPVTQDILHIKSENTINSIWINNISGQLLLSKKCGTNTTEINVSSLSPGVYILSFETDKGLFHQKIQIQ